MASVAQIPQIPANPALNSEVGEAQRLFAERAQAETERVIATGQCLPFTIVNFNPVPLDLSGVLKQYRIPSPDDDRLPHDVLRTRIEWDGVERRGHALTIRYPKKDGRMVDAKKLDNNTPGEPIVQREVRLYLPQEIAYCFVERYSPVFTAASMPGVVQAAPPKDARRIFGVLAFEGDIHLLERILDEDDPARRVINVPICQMRTIGKTSFREFRTVQYPLDKYLEQMFAGQRKYADAIITRAQQKFVSGLDDEIKDISESDRIWYRWAIKLGFAREPKSGEKTWLNEYTTLTGADTKAPDNRRKCQACKTPEPELNTPFCPKCNAPINTFDTFMAGFPVPDAWLMALKGDERDIVLKELEIRRQGFGASGTPTSERAKRGPYKKGREAAATATAQPIDPATQEIPEAGSTAMPGEED